MVMKRRGNKQGVNGAAIEMEVVSSRLINLDDEVTLEPCTSSHWQVRCDRKVLVDLWPTTGKFRVHDAPQGSPAIGSTNDVLAVVEWLLERR